MGSFLWHMWICQRLYPQNEIISNGTDTVTIWYRLAGFQPLLTSWLECTLDTHLWLVYLLKLATKNGVSRYFPWKLIPFQVPWQGIRHSPVPDHIRICFGTLLATNTRCISTASTCTMPQAPLGWWATGTLFFSDIYSTLWPSTVLRWFSLMSLGFVGCVIDNPPKWSFRSRKTRTFHEP